MNRLNVYILAFLIASVSALQVDAQEVNADRVGFTSLFTVVKADTQTHQIQYQLNPNAVSFIQSYLEKQGPSLQKMKTWAKPYFNLYDQILIANGIPTTLKYLSVIESSLNAGVVSWAGAAGPWQIMPEEAKRLGLKLTPVDERMDYEKSTQAAATILRESFAEFGDWLLVVAAYNGGAGRVRQAIKKKGTKDFWVIQYELPLETRNHVKKYIATQYVFETEQFEMYDAKPSLIKTKKVDRLSSNEQIETVWISGRYQLAIIAKTLSIDLKFLQENNLGIEKLLASGKSYELKLPKGMLEKFEARKNEILQASLSALYQFD
jgi:membrane-bound lytic murein transglycosylase D